MPVQVPAELHREVWALPEVRMGVYLAAVSLRDGRTISPVIVNARPEFLGVARAADLEAWDSPGFTADEVVGLDDASRYFD